MKTLGLLLSSLVAATSLSAQKPPIDASVYERWPAVGGGTGISPDGRYVKYAIDNQPVGGRTLVFQSTDARWKLEIPGADVFSAALTPDSRHAVFLGLHDSLGLVTLGRSGITYIPQVRSFQVPKTARSPRLVYQRTTPDTAVVVRDLSTAKEIVLPGAEDYVLSDDGTILLLQTTEAAASAGHRAVSWVSLPDGKRTTIWTGQRAGQRASRLVLDAGATQSAFVVHDSAEGQATRTFWYYQRGAAQAVLLADDRAPGLPPDLLLDDLRRFSVDGERLFISLRPVPTTRPTPKPGAVPVHVWHYKDPKLQSRQVHELSALDDAPSYTAAVRLADRQIVPIQREPNEWVMLPNEAHVGDHAGRVDDFVLVVRPAPSGRFEESTTFLVSTEDGSRTSIELGAVLSPGGRYVLYYEPKAKAYHSYETATGTTRTLTAGLSVTWAAFDDLHRPSDARGARGVAGWLPGDRAVLVYDRHDLWQLDPSGAVAPINLTNGYGRRHDIVFELGLEYPHRVVASTDKLLLLAFDRATKDNGFFHARLGAQRDPERLTMGPYLYLQPAYQLGRKFGGQRPQRAREAEVYLVERMRAVESPNYFVTTDFKSFRRLTDIRPERTYNWLTTELVTWTSVDGLPTQGVLYKPENFDPGKKYPVIFHYYETKADGLHGYMPPAALGSGCNINIPWYVSNGYLVFTPNVHYPVGDPGAATKHVVSAAEELSKRPWVDAKRMGIQGCSYGGFQTGYLVTHSDLFAAAVASSGLYDFVSAYGGLMDNGTGMHGFFEGGEFRMPTLWQRPDLYLANSPVLRADQVTTPVLLMHTTHDGVCRFPQAVEFFTALRRLGKRAWMLQYDDGNHGIFGESAADFSVRMAQFFDHYLKGAPPPKWMTQGVPAKLKGIETGLELDLSGKEP